MAAEKSHVFRPHTTLSRWLLSLLGFSGMLYLVMIFTGVNERRTLNGIKEGSFPSTEEMIAAAEFSDLLQGSIAILFLLVWLPTMALSLVWIYRSACNAHALSRVRVHPSPGWAVGWYFVPFAHLFKPYSAMKEIWAASSNPQDWKRLPTPAILKWWWFFWITAAFLGRTSGQMTLRAETIDALLQANLVSLIDEIWTLPLLVVFGLMVKRLTAMQLAATPASESDEPFIDATELPDESSASSPPRGMFSHQPSPAAAPDR